MAITVILGMGPHLCYACDELAGIQCDNCDRWFCAEHQGQRGGDREGGEGVTGPYGAYAVPSLCEACVEKRP